MRMPVRDFGTRIYKRLKSRERLSANAIPARVASECFLVVIVFYRVEVAASGYSDMRTVMLTLLTSGRRTNA